MTFGLQNAPIIATPTGRIDSEYPTGNDGSGVAPSWNTAGFPTLTTLQVGTAFSVDLATYLTDPGSPTSSLGFYNVSGQGAVAAGFSISGTVLSNPCLLATSGVFRLVAVRNNVSVLTSLLSFQISAPAGTDNVAPTVPTGITVTPGTAIGTVSLSFDPPCDIAPGNVAASGTAHVDCFVAGTLAAPPTPILTAANSLATPTGVNIGSISSPGPPSYSQNGKVWTLTAAGTGISTTSSEQCLLLDFGTFSGAQKFVAKIDPYTSSAGTALVGLMIHETAAAGGKFLAWGLRPSNGTVGLILETRATASTNSAQQTILTTDTSGASIVGPVYLRIQRSADLATVTVHYSLDERGWTLVSTQTIAMTSGVHYGLVATSQSAGTQTTAFVEEVAISSGGRLSAVITTTQPVSIQLRSVDAGGNTSALSTAITGVPSVAATGTAVKFHGGFYFWPNNYHYDSATINTNFGLLDGVKTNANVSGMELDMYLSAYDSGTTGPDYSAGRALVQGVLDRAATYSPKKRIILEINDRVFGTSTGTPLTAAAPKWWINNGWVICAASGTSYSGSGLSQICTLWNSAATDALIALIQQYGAWFDTHPNLEMFSPMGESAVGGPPPGFNGPNYYAQIKRIMIVSSAAFPHTLIRMRLNFTQGDSSMADLIATARSLPNVCIGPTDPEVPVPFVNYPTGPPVTRTTQAIGIFRGETGSGLSPGTYPDNRGVIPFCAEVQALGLGVSFTNLPADFISTAISQDGAYHMVFLYNTTNGGAPQQWSTGILPAINAHGPVLTATLPTNGIWDTT